MRFYHYLFMLLFAMDLAAAAQSKSSSPKPKSRGRLRRTHGWSSMAGCGADSNGQTVTALNVSSSERPYLDAAIAGNAKCPSFERIAVYSCIPEPPPIQGLWEKIAPVINFVNAGVGTFPQAGALSSVEEVFVLGASFLTSQVMEGVSTFSASPDFASLGKDFETLVNKEIEKVFACIRESGHQIHAQQELHEWNVIMGNIDSHILLSSAAEVTNRFKTFFTGSLFPSDPLYTGRQTEALTTLEAIIPTYISVAADYLASLYGFCKTARAVEYCSDFGMWQKRETGHVDIALEWLYKVKRNMLAQYESWTPKECDEWTNVKYDSVKATHYSGDRTVTRHYTSHRECGSFTADIACVKEGTFYCSMKESAMQSTCTISYGNAKVEADSVRGLNTRTHDSLSGWTQIWIGDWAEYDRNTLDEDHGLSVVQQQVNDAITEYEADLKSWSTFFDNKYISSLMKFREDINSIVFDEQSNGWKQICYPQDECADLYMNKSDNGNYECVKMPGKCAQQRHARWQMTCGGTASYNAPCVFPFTYKGTEYNKCITHDHKDGRPWCSTTANYDKDGKWGNCDDCKSWELRTCDGTGRNAPCSFPFEYKGIKYYDCTTIDRAQPWCSTTANYTEDKRWGNCACQPWELKTCDGTGQNKPCVFPFTYKKKKYYDCTTIDHEQLWCSTTANYDTDKKWGNCDCADEAAAMSNPFERIGDDFIDDGSDEMPVYGPSGGEYSPYLFYFVAFVPCLLCLFVNVFCAYKQCVKKEDSYDKVRFVEEEEEEEDKELMDQDNKI